MNTMLKNKFTRRQLIAKLIQLYGGMVFFPLHLMKVKKQKKNFTDIGNYQYIDPQVAIAIVKFVWDVITFFRKPKEINYDLIEIALLAEISIKIDNIQQSLAQINTSINDLKIILGELPSDVVQELTGKEIIATLNQYKTLMATLSNYIEKHGQVGRSLFLERFTSEIQDNIISTLDAKKNILFSYSNYINIPILAACCKIEYECRKLIGEPEERIKSILVDYYDRFKRKIYGPDPAPVRETLKASKKAKNELRDKIESPKFYKEVFEFENDPSYVSTLTAAYNYKFKLKKEINEADYIKGLLEEKLISENDLFYNINERYSEKYLLEIHSYYVKENKYTIKNKKISMPERNRVRNGPGQDLSVRANFRETAPKVKDEFYIKERNNYQNNFDLQTAKVLAQSSSLSSGFDVLEFLNQKLKS